MDEDEMYRIMRDVEHQAQMRRVYEEAVRQNMVISGGAGGGGVFSPTSLGGAARTPPPPRWVLVEVTYTDGTAAGINYDSNTVSVQKLIEEASKTNMFCPRNDTEWLIVPVARIKSITVKKLSTGE